MLGRGSVGSYEPVLEIKVHFSSHLDLFILQFSGLEVGFYYNTIRIL